MQWHGDRNENIPVGAVGAQHGSVAGGMCGTGTGTSSWEQWVHSIAQWCVGHVGTGLVPSTSQRVCSGEHVAQPGQHVGRGPSQPWHVFTGCQPHLPGWWSLVGKVWAEQGQDGIWLAHGNLLNHLEVLPAGRWHISHTCWGSSAIGLSCYSAHTAPAVRLLFQILSQLCDSLGRAPQSLADCLDHAPLGKEYAGQMPKVALWLALPNVITRHPSAQCGRAVPP